MGKALIIAEKPSVALDISKALGGFQKVEDYFENDQYVVCSAVGHLLELVPPADCEVKRGKWTFGQLPVIPDHFDLKPISKTESRLKLLLKLARRDDVDLLINACDAGREGELIFRYIVQHFENQARKPVHKPIKRLWLQSMTQSAIREGFQKLRTDEQLRPLAQAAVCRSESDWLVGINGTRAMTAFNSKTGGFHLTTVGRVQTPTLAIVVQREEKIKNFKAQDYWEVHAGFGTPEGAQYIGRWFDESFRKTGEKEESSHQRAERIWEEAKAQSIMAACQGKSGEVSQESKSTTKGSPLLYDLTSLQREANGRFGFSAKRTLQIAQALYERHKMLTYPRTDSRALPEDYLGTVKATLGNLAAGGYRNPANKILENGWVHPNKRIFNNAKISDHHAIIPTSLKPKPLRDDEAKLFDMVVKRFLAVFYPPAEFEITTRITRVEGEPFKSEGKVIINPGWMEVYGREAEEEDGKPSLAPVQNGSTVQTESIEVHGDQTRPPARFTEATLLSAMEGAGKLVDDEELREAMSAKGLGTPATRAAIIEGLLAEKYLVRQGRELVPMAKAFSLITLLRGLGVQELCAPELTGEWEFKLKQMEAGTLQREEFMRQIAEMTRHMVEQAKSFESDTIPGDFGKLAIPCPKCGSVIKETYKKFQCENEACDFSTWKIIGGRQLELDEMEQLIRERQIGPLQGFRNKKTGWPFAAILRLSPENRIEFDFGNEKEDGEEEAVDFSDQEPLGQCPACSGRVFAHGMHYVCENSVGPDKSCKFRSGKIICQRDIKPEEMRKLLQDRKTDLLTRFISKKGRPFSAFLVLDQNKVGFEFQPRGAATKKVARKAPATTKKAAGE